MWWLIGVGLAVSVAVSFLTGFYLGLREKRADLESINAFTNAMNEFRDEAPPAPRRASTAEIVEIIREHRGD
jgi:hypothetical protein